MPGDLLDDLVEHAQLHVLNDLPGGTAGFT